jgi:hypothetical protein
MSNAVAELGRLGTPRAEADTGHADGTPAPAVRRVALRIDPARLCRAHGELAARLTRAGVRVSLLKGRSRDGLPGSTTLLLQLERLVHRIREPLLSDPLDAALFEHAAPSSENSDLVIDFCGGDERGRGLRVLYDGTVGEAALIGALVAGRMPVIDIVDAVGAIIATGVPANDNAGTITGSLDCVLARVVTLTQAAICAPRPASPVTRPAAQSAGLRDLIAFEAKALAGAIVHRLYKLCFHTPHWRTCWRHVDGPDLWQTQDVRGTAWNVLPDPGFRFYADPFPFVHQGRSYVFVEDLDHRTNKGCISVVPFGEHGPTGPAEPVLEEPWHLSYPSVFAHAGQVWMVPESSANRTVRLYRADPFPHRWVEEAILISDLAASDATVIRHDGAFWMFAATRDGFGSWSDALSLFHAPRLHGPWQAHPANPVLVDRAAARPGGAMVVRDGKLWRPVQDCTAGYGCGIGLAEITRLDQEGFEQKVRTILRPDPSWPGRRFHTLNRAGRLECIDGSAYSPRSRTIARRLQAWSGRRDMPDSPAGADA